ncbi:TPA: hypothetical protein DDZ01_03200 [Candidatus Uhrbacteria bacterium]|nr:MAG: hypothetical protein A2332_03670 [Candidatus Uhrbacteria bacterium RIFOXYB2_FULL_41_18]HBK34976.1 hypothetical protein [Candidatus Uhrbacteria bacterium]HCB56018.1 hypothetical protein [Candidatus Uhrbacteria bacterium]
MHCVLNLKHGLHNSMEISEWQEVAKNKLNDQQRKMTDEYRTILTRQAQGKCLSCGIGMVIDIVKKENRIDLIFGCGHGHVEVCIEETISVRESSNLLVVPEGKGKRQFIQQSKQGWFSSENPDLPDGVYVERVIDKRRNLYKEKVVDSASKEKVITDQEHPLRDHQGHGSAKFKKKK